MTMSPEQGAAVVDALEHVGRVSGGRVFAAVVPAVWSDDQIKRLARVVNKVLEAGEGGLRCVEHAMEG